MEALRMLSAKGPGGSDYEAEVERLLSCPICLEVYSKPVVILPCQHNLCRKCANDVFQNRGTPMGSGGRFRCPTCRYEVMLDRHGVYGLQRNLLVENIIDMYQSESKKPFRKVEVLMCEEHEDEKVNIFCVTCQKPTCSMCKVFGAHQQCTVSPVDTVYKDHKSEISGAIAMLVAGNDRLQNIISKTEELTVKTEENSKAVQSDVCCSFDKLYAVLEQRKQAMLSKVKALTQEKTEILQSMLKTYGTQLESSSKLVEEALSLLEEPCAPQFLSVSRELINRVTSTAKATDVRKPPSDIHQMGMFAVNFSNHAKYLSKINFPERDDEDVGSEEYETTSDHTSEVDSEVASSVASTTHSGDVFQAKLLLPKAEEAEEVVAAAKVTRSKDDDDNLSVTSRSDYNGSERRESNISFDDDKQLDQLDDDVKAIAERYLSGRASRPRSQASAQSDAAEARRRSYSEEEKKKQSKQSDQYAKPAYRYPRTEPRDMSPVTVSFRPSRVSASSRFQMPYTTSQSPDRLWSSGSTPRSNSPNGIQEWRTPSTERRPSNGISEYQDTRPPFGQPDMTLSPSRGSLTVPDNSTHTPRTRRAPRRLQRNYTTHRRRTWSHLLDKK